MLMPYGNENEGHVLRVVLRPACTAEVIKHVVYTIHSFREAHGRCFDRTNRR
jgi:hypothetical protein